MGRDESEWWGFRISPLKRCVFFHFFRWLLLTDNVRGSQRKGGNFVHFWGAFVFFRELACISRNHRFHSGFLTSLIFCGGWVEMGSSSMLGGDQILVSPFFPIFPAHLVVVLSICFLGEGAGVWLWSCCCAFVVFVGWFCFGFALVLLWLLLVLLWFCGCCYCCCFVWCGCCRFVVVCLFILFCRCFCVFVERTTNNETNEKYINETPCFQCFCLGQMTGVGPLFVFSSPFFCLSPFPSFILMHCNTKFIICLMV